MMKKMKSVAWHLYIVECRDGTYYTGITNDLARRIADHNRGKASRYTHGRRPVRLLYTEGFPDRSGALKREAAIHSWPRRKKEALVKGASPPRAF